MKVKTKGRVVFAMAILIAILIYSVAKCEVYEVPNFLGGLNIAGDSTELAPNEAIILKNMTLDKYNVLTPRQGWSFVDSTIIDTTKDIDDIFIYEPYAGTQRMVIVSNGFVYIKNSLTALGTVDWDTLRLSFEGDSIAPWGTRLWNNIYGADHWYTRVSSYEDTSGIGDVLTYNSTDFKIGRVYTNRDSSLTTSEAHGSTDTLAYEITKRLRGTPDLFQYQDKLFIMDSEGYPLIYNDTSYQFMALIDSGTVTDSIDLDSASIIYQETSSGIGYGATSKSIYRNLPDDSISIIDKGVSENDNFVFLFVYRGSEGNINEQIWNSYITGIDTTTYSPYYDVVYLAEDFDLTGIPVYNQLRFWITHSNHMCPGTNNVLVIDSSKNWYDFELGSDFLQSFFAVPALSGGYLRNGSIFCNDDSAFSTNTHYLGADDFYYIFSMQPYPEIFDSTAISEFPLFEQIIDYRDQIYGFGVNDSTGSSLSKNTDKNVVRYSHPLIPTYMPDWYNFALGLNDDISVMFVLLDNLYLGTTEGIWRVNGSPTTQTTGGDLSVKKVVSGNGIPNKDVWVKATEEYGYYANSRGVFRFNGIRPERIDWKIEPLYESYYASDMILGYQDYRLYISFPKIHTTIVFDERYNAFYTFDFGMTAFYAPPNTNTFYFGHSLYKGYVFTYPNGLYYDVRNGVGQPYDMEYESGWQPLGKYWQNKSLTEGYFPVTNTAASNIRIYKDFETTASDSVVCDSTFKFVYRKQFDADCVGEYFKVRFKGGADSSLVFGRYTLMWEEQGQWIK